MEFRLRADSKERIEQAAELVQLPVGDFVRQAAEARADDGNILAAVRAMPLIAGPVVQRHGIKTVAVTVEPVRGRVSPGDPAATAQRPGRLTAGPPWRLLLSDID